MTDHDERKNRHFILGGFTETERFRRPLQKVERQQVPERDRYRHGTALLSQVEALKPEILAAREAQEEGGLEGGFGLRVEFESFPDIELAFESLARERSGIELLNVRHEDHCTYATIFVPDGKLEHFEGLIRDYLNDKRDKLGRARDHKTLINTIRQIRTASLRALWTDDAQVTRPRINAAARDEEEGTRSGGDDPSWRIGKQNRHKGSLHSDIWQGKAAELASRGILAVYPAVGWWKIRTRLERYDKAARYALVVSIRAPEVEVDLYSAVANQIAVPVVVEH